MSGATSATGGRKPHAEPNLASLNITFVKAGVERVILFDNFKASDRYTEDNGRDENNDSVGFSDVADQRSLHVRDSSNPRGVSTRMASEREEEEDKGQDVTPAERPRYVTEPH